MYENLWTGRRFNKICKCHFVASNNIGVFDYNLLPHLDLKKKKKQKKKKKKTIC